MRKTSSVPAFVALVILGIGWGFSFIVYRVTGDTRSEWIGIIVLALALSSYLATNIANQWERAVI